MKKLYLIQKTIITAFLVTLSFALQAQSPQLVSYQAIVRDASNNPKVNTEVSLIMTVNQGSASGTQVYSETHTVTTNNYGLINVELGGGSDPVGDFSTIDWSNSPYYLSINIDGNDMDPVQLVSVPYAIYADQAGNVFSGEYNDLTNKPFLNITNWNTAFGWGDHSTMGYYDSKWKQSDNDVFVQEDMQVGIGTSNPLNNMLLVAAGKETTADDPIFQVVNTDGIPVFTIFNDGSVDVQLLDDLENKGPKGGFAIGGFDPSKGELTTMPFMSIGPDSTRFYFNEAEKKGPKGGFAIGGFDRSKGKNEQYSAYITGEMDEEKIRTLRLDANTGIKKDADKIYALDVNGIINAEDVMTKSDFRFKTNIQTITDPLSRILSMRGVTFSWNNKASSAGKKSMGLIAQEAIEVVPELVSKGSEYYSINYAPLTALLIEAVKELKKENDKMREELSKVEELERQVQELRGLISK
ncbi:MAG: tail fiber domain-containing protein [Bacteroidales bacterium]|nr:tail fiber domain-containing protein [Bacteroidales bacterium]